MKIVRIEMKIYALTNVNKVTTIQFVGLVSITITSSKSVQCNSSPKQIHSGYPDRKRI